MSSKHTPGPWSISDETVRDGLRSRLLYGMPEGMLAIIRVEHQGRYYGDANARLIAAAPDMASAIINTIATLEAEFGKSVARQNFPDLYAAIAKAQDRETAE